LKDQYYHYLDDTDEDQDNDDTPNEGQEERSHHCFAACIPATSTCQIYTDQTGKFLSAASSGATQLFVLYDYDSNSIHGAPMSTRTGPDIIKAFKGIHNTIHWFSVNTDWSSSTPVISMYYLMQTIRAIAAPKVSYIFV
jgi:hypothetical protein